MDCIHKIQGQHGCSLEFVILFTGQDSLTELRTITWTAGALSDPWLQSNARRAPTYIQCPSIRPPSCRATPMVCLHKLPGDAHGYREKMLWTSSGLLLLAVVWICMIYLKLKLNKSQFIGQETQENKKKNIKTKTYRIYQDHIKKKGSKNYEYTFKLLRTFSGKIMMNKIITF